MCRLILIPRRVQMRSSAEFLKLQLMWHFSPLWVCLYRQVLISNQGEWGKHEVSFFFLKSPVKLDFGLFAPWWRSKLQNKTTSWRSLINNSLSLVTNKLWVALLLWGGTVIWLSSDPATWHTLHVSRCAFHSRMTGILNTRDLPNNAWKHWRAQAHSAAEEEEIWFIRSVIYRFS